MAGCNFQIKVDVASACCVCRSLLQIWLHGACMVGPEGGCWLGMEILNLKIVFRQMPHLLLTCQCCCVCPSKLIIALACLQGKSIIEIETFCQAFMTELSKHIGAHTDPLPLSQHTPLPCKLPAWCWALAQSAAP